MTTTTLDIVRHAESTLNKAKTNTPLFFTESVTRDLFLNSPDHKVSITADGIKQAFDTGKCLGNNGNKYSVAIHSGYKRTRQTFEQIQSSVQIQDVVEMIEFRERENGYGYVMTADEIQEHFPWAEQYWKTVGPIFARPVGGESLMDLYSRVKPALNEIVLKYKGKNIMLVTHGRVITIIRYILEGWSVEYLENYLNDSSQNPINCGVTRYTFDKNMLPTLVSYNKKYW